MRNDDTSGLSPYAQQETTVKGCGCTNQCGTSVGHYYKCDWCNVPRSCSGGKWSPTRGRWDHCAFEEVSQYESQTAVAKQGSLWSLVMASKGQIAPLPSTASTLRTILTTNMRGPFDNARDIMAVGREKAIHVQGVVCKFDLQIWNGSPYSGSFAPGRHPGLMRMGSATPAPSNFPGVAFKFLRSGMPASGFMALRESGDKTNTTFFGESMSNHVAPPKMLVALQKFQQASDCVSMVGLSDLCTYDHTGKRTQNVKFPFKVLVEPHADAAQYDANGNGVLGALNSIPTGKRLFTLRAQASPTSSNSQAIGTFITTSQCTTTLFGDKEMHFRHERMEADFLLRPEWRSKVNMAGCDAAGRKPENFMCGDQQDAFPEE